MFKSLLFLNGSLPDLSEVKFHKVTSIAADGDVLHRLQNKGHTPQFIIGDGDGCNSPSSRAESRDLLHVLVDPDQETNDFEKCLRYIAESNLSPTIVYGIGGGEIDHQHNNLHCFAKYAKTHPMIFLDSQESYPTKLGLCVRKNLTIEVEVGTTISLLPFPYAQLTTEGLEWVLKNERLALLERSGARNRASHSQVKIQINEGGPLLVVVNASCVSHFNLDHWEVKRAHWA